MEQLRPDVSAPKAKILEALKGNRRVRVEGPIGAGRGTIARSLAEDPNAVVLDLLPLDETDAPGVALMEYSAVLQPSDRPRLVRGTESEVNHLAREVSSRLASTPGRFLIIRHTPSWPIEEVHPEQYDPRPGRAHALLSGLFHGPLPVVLVVDTGVRCDGLGFHPDEVVHLPPHRIGVRTLQHLDWGPYSWALSSLTDAVDSRAAASPLAWRFAVGLVALGDPPEAAAVLAARDPALPNLADRLARLIGREPSLVEGVALILALRRPIRKDALLSILCVPQDHIPLFTQCLGYGNESVRVTSQVRQILRRDLAKRAEVTRVAEVNQQNLANHYKAVDGAPSPWRLPPDATRSWCEKVHHLARGSAVGHDEWGRQVLASPEQYWERGRFLSLEKHDYRLAAEVYDKCLSAFPEDAYAWHYFAWNLLKAGMRREAIEPAYRKAVQLDQDNPWWNSRLVTHLIADARPEAARREWREVIRRVDPDGAQLAEGPWLAKHMYQWVAEGWLNAGRAAWAEDVVRPVPGKYRVLPAIVRESTTGDRLRAAGDGHSLIEGLKRPAGGSKKDHRRFLSNLSMKFTERKAA